MKIAKIQIAGPFTSQWALKLKDGSTPDRHPELSSQIYQLVLARSLAMVHRMRACGIQPILYIDEPGFYGLSLTNPKHLLGLQELKLMIQTLRKAGALVGIHCCSNTSWEAVLGLGVNILSLDTSLSLGFALEAGRAEKTHPLEDFILSGGVLSLGIIPTTRSSALRALNAQTLADQLISVMGHHWEAKPQLVKRVFQEAIYTPACGLAFQSTSDVELVLEKLAEVYEYFHS